MKWFNLKHIQNRLGFSAMELMTGVALTGVVAIFVMNLTTDQQKNINTTKKQNQVEFLTNIAGLVLSDNRGCIDSLAGLNNGATIISIRKGAKNFLQSGSDYAENQHQEGNAVSSVNLNMTLDIEEDIDPQAGRFNERNAVTSSTQSVRRKSNHFVGTVNLEFTNVGATGSTQTRSLKVFGTLDDAGSVKDCNGDFGDQNFGATLSAEQRFCLEFYARMEYVPHNLGTRINQETVDGNIIEGDISNQDWNLNPSSCLGAVAANGAVFRTNLRNALNRKICENMGGNFSSGNCDFRYEATTGVNRKSCPINQFLVGFNSDGTPNCSSSTRMLASENTGGGGDDDTGPGPDCVAPATHAWGNCSASGGQSVGRGQNITIQDRDSTDQYTGTIEFRCDIDGSTSYGPPTCERNVQNCTGQPSYVWGSHCSAVLEDKNHTEVAQLTFNGDSWTGNVDLRCNNGQWEEIGDAVCMAVSAPGGDCVGYARYEDLGTDNHGGGNVSSVDRLDMSFGQKLTGVRFEGYIMETQYGNNEECENMNGTADVECVRNASGGSEFVLSNENIRGTPVSCDGSEERNICLVEEGKEYRDEYHNGLDVKISFVPNGSAELAPGESRSMRGKFCSETDDPNEDGSPVISSDCDDNANVPIKCVPSAIEGRSPYIKIDVY